MPSDDWLPKLSRVGGVMTVSEARAELKIPPPAVIAKAEVPVPVKPARGRWRFVPERDANNLIVEIIATPIE